MQRMVAVLAQGGRFRPCAVPVDGQTTATAGACMKGRIAGRMALRVSYLFLVPLINPCQTSGLFPKRRNTGLRRLVRRRLRIQVCVYQQLLICFFRLCKRRRRGG